MSENNYPDWIVGSDAAMTVCDKNGKIIFMNSKSEAIFEKDGGRDLIGKNLFDCHPEHASAILREMLSTGRPNVYTIAKGGLRKMIYQAPWKQDGVFAGFVELSLELPDVEIPHYFRD